MVSVLNNRLPAKFCLTAPTLKQARDWRPPISPRVITLSQNKFNSSIINSSFMTWIVDRSSFIIKSRYSSSKETNNTYNTALELVNGFPNTLQCTHDPAQVHTLHPAMTNISGQCALHRDSSLHRNAVGGPFFAEPLKNTGGLGSLTRRILDAFPGAPPALGRYGPCPSH